MNDSANGMILSIERCSMHDGPGIRTTVFLKGCPLSCLWCHNPESQSFKPELFFLQERCVCCGLCQAACRQHVHTIADGEHHIDRIKCHLCGACVKACPRAALEIKGAEMSVAEVMAVVLKDCAYYEDSGGGLTLSGGEPMAQFPFSLALMQTARKAAIHTCLETCAHAPVSRLLEIAPSVDLFLIDWKESDPEKHLAYTGVDLQQIRENLGALSRAGAQILLRCPIVPGLNDRADHFATIAALAEELDGIGGIEIMPYHPLGASKSRSIGRDYALPDIDFADAESANQWRAAIAARTSKPVK